MAVDGTNTILQSQNAQLTKVDPTEKTEENVIPQETPVEEGAEEAGNPGVVVNLSHEAAETRQVDAPAESAEENPTPTAIAPQEATEPPPKPEAADNETERHVRKTLDVVV